MASNTTEHCLLWVRDPPYSLLSILHNNLRDYLNQPTPTPTSDLIISKCPALPTGLQVQRSAVLCPVMQSPMMTGGTWQVQQTGDGLKTELLNAHIVSLRLQLFRNYSPNFGH